MPNRQKSSSAEISYINVKNAKCLPSCKHAKLIECKNTKSKEQHCVKNELKRCHHAHLIDEIEVVHEQPSTSVHRRYQKYVIKHPNFHKDTKECLETQYLCSNEICKACCGPL